MFIAVLLVCGWCVNSDVEFTENPLKEVTTHRRATQSTHSHTSRPPEVVVWVFSGGMSNLVERAHSARTEETDTLDGYGLDVWREVHPRNASWFFGATPTVG